MFICSVGSNQTFLKEHELSGAIYLTNGYMQINSIYNYFKIKIAHCYIYMIGRNIYYMDVYIYIKFCINTYYKVYIHT